MKRKLLIQIGNFTSDIWMERTEEDLPPLSIGTEINFNESGTTLDEVRHTASFLDNFVISHIEYFHSLKMELWTVKFHIPPSILVDSSDSRKLRRQEVQKEIVAHLEQRGWQVSKE